MLPTGPRGRINTTEEKAHASQTDSTAKDEPARRTRPFPLSRMGAAPSVIAALHGTFREPSWPTLAGRAQSRAAPRLLRSLSHGRRSS